MAAALSSPAPSRRPYGGQSAEDFTKRLKEIKEARKDLADEVSKLKDKIKDSVKKAQKLLDKHDDAKGGSGGPGGGNT